MNIFIANFCGKITFMVKGYKNWFNEYRTFSYSLGIPLGILHVEIFCKIMSYCNFFCKKSKI